MPPDELTVILTDSEGRLSAETLKNAIEHALDMFRGVEAGVVTSGTIVHWDVVRVSMRSPLKMTFSPRMEGTANRNIGKEIVKACMYGIETIEKSATLPPYFNDKALDAAKQLVKTAASEGTLITIAANGQKKVPLTENTIRNVEEIISKARHYIDFTTIEGLLEVLSVHDGFKCFIWEVLTNQKIECEVTEEQFRSTISLLSKRVAVTGRVKYKNHVPKSIKVDVTDKSQRSQRFNTGSPRRGQK